MCSFGRFYKSVSVCVCTAAVFYALYKHKLTKMVANAYLIGWLGVVGRSGCIFGTAWRVRAWQSLFLYAGQSAKRRRFFNITEPQLFVTKAFKKRLIFFGQSWGMFTLKLPDLLSTPLFKIILFIPFPLLFTPISPLICSSLITFILHSSFSRILLELTKWKW